MTETYKYTPTVEVRKNPATQALERKTYSIKEATEASKRALTRLRESIVEWLGTTLKEAIEKQNLAPDHSFSIFKEAMEQPTPRNVAEAQKILRNSRTVGRVRVDGILGRETLKAMLKFVKMGIENFPAGEYPASKADGEIYTDPTLMDTQSDIFKGASTKLPPKVKKPETKKILNENIPSSKKPPVSTTDND